MSRMPIYSSEKEFVAKIQSQEFGRALMDVTGRSANALKVSRELISMMGFLPEEQLRSLMEWAQADLHFQQQQALLKIPNDLLYIPETVARHEVGHALVGRALGFQLGAMHIKISSANGDHTGSAAATCDRSFKSEDEIANYLEDRVVVLMAGTMAEADKAELIGWDFDARFKKSLSDYSKTMDFMQILANLKAISLQSYYDNEYPRLRNRTSDMVRDQYTLIQGITAQLMKRIEAFGLMYGWTADEFAEIVSKAEVEIS